MNFTTRRAAPADADKMLAIWQEAATMLAGLDKRYTLAADAGARWQEALRGWLGQDDMALFVAESTAPGQEGKLLGYIVGSIQTNLVTHVPQRCGYVSDLAVDGHAKTGGIGRELFEALKGWFRQQGLTHVEVRVPHRHAVAQAFWRAIGASELYDQMWLKVDE